MDRKVISKSWDGVVNRVSYNYYLCEDDEEEDDDEFFPTFQG